VRAMIPQVQRTVEAADALSTRLSGPIDQVIPGLNRLAQTLNSPVLTSLPADLAEFMNVVNELSRRLSPLGQIAEQAGGLFGIRLPTRPEPAPAPPPPAPPPPEKAPAEKRTAAKRTAPKRSTES
jgi:hypothetical protein